MKTNLLTNMSSVKTRRLVCICMLVVMLVMIATASFVFADDDDDAAAESSLTGISGAIKSLSGTFYDELLGIAPFVGIAYLAVVGVILMTGGKNAVENARKGLLIAAGAILLVYLAPVIVAFIKGALTNIGGKAAFDKLN